MGAMKIHAFYDNDIEMMHPHADNAYQLNGISQFRIVNENAVSFSIVFIYFENENKKKFQRKIKIPNTITKN